MDNQNYELPDELRAVENRLRGARAESNPLRMDELKQQVLARSHATFHKGGLIKTRIATLMTVLGLVAGTGGAIAVAGGSSTSGPSASAAKGEYCSKGKCKPPCPKGQHEGNNRCECPKGQHKGDNRCECPKGEHMYSEKCHHNKKDKDGDFDNDSGKNDRKHHDKSEHHKNKKDKDGDYDNSGKNDHGKSDHDKSKGKDKTHGTEKGTSHSKSDDRDHDNDTD